MKKLTLTAGGLAAGALLVGTLAAPAVAAGTYPGPHPEKKKCSSEPDISSDIVDFAGAPLFGTVFHVATNRSGRAYLRDSRVPDTWISLGLIPGAPRCTQDVAVSVTESLPGELFITLLADSGVHFRTTCATSATPLSPTNIAAVCTGFTTGPGAPIL